MNSLFWERNRTILAAEPQSYNSDVTSGYVPIKGSHDLTIVLFKGVGDAGDDLTISVKQATDSSGTGAKALNVTHVGYQVGTATSATTVKITATDTIDLVSGLGSDIAMDSAKGILFLHIPAESLDQANGFNHIALFSEGDAITAGVASTYAAVAVICEPRYPGASIPA